MGQSIIIELTQMKKLKSIFGYNLDVNLLELAEKIY